MNCDRCVVENQLRLRSSCWLLRSRNKEAAPTLNAFDADAVNCAISGCRKLVRVGKDIFERCERDTIGITRSLLKLAPDRSVYAQR
jgi:hypothetical protein